jgi:hypothetical protein
MKGLRPPGHTRAHPLQHQRHHNTNLKDHHHNQKDRHRNRKDHRHNRRDHHRNKKDHHRNQKDQPNNRLPTPQWSSAEEQAAVNARVALLSAVGAAAGRAPQSTTDTHDRPSMGDSVCPCGKWREAMRDICECGTSVFSLVCVKSNTDNLLGRSNPRARVKPPPKLPLPMLAAATAVATTARPPPTAPPSCYHRCANYNGTITTTTISRSTLSSYHGRTNCIGGTTTSVATTTIYCHSTTGGRNSCDSNDRPIWLGTDGARSNAHHYNSYNAQLPSRTTTRRWRDSVGARCCTNGTTGGQCVVGSNLDSNGQRKGCANLGTT